MLRLLGKRKGELHDLRTRYDVQNDEHEQRLNELEKDFRPLLLSCLRECARGRYALFGQNDGPGMGRYSHWDEAEQLKEIAVEIRELRAEFGQPNSQVDEFLRLCSLRGLAQQLSAD